MNLFDTHFHPADRAVFAQHLAAAEAVGVTRMLAVGADMTSSELAMELADSHDNVWFAAGVHPHEAEKINDGIDEFAKFAENAKMLAVGEIGIDFFYGFSNRESQERVFGEFLTWAGKINKPVIVHCRDKDGREDAFDCVYGPLRAFAARGGRVFVHCFTGGVEWAERFIDIGAHIGVTGIVTFPKAGNVRAVLDVIPADRLLLETDAPYLAPKPHRGKTNQPAYLLNIAKFVAEHKKIPLAELAARTTANAMRFFNIGAEA